MPFCHVCQSLPFRYMFRCHAETDVAELPFLSFPSPGRDDDGLFVKWHPNISQLQHGFEHCSFCCMIYSHLESSYHYKRNVQVGDERALWLGGLEGSYLFACIGNTAPEARISGNFWFSTTPDSSVAQFFNKHDVIEDPLHPFVLGKMEHWLQSCDESHVECARNLEVLLPTRLLDLGSLPGKKDLSGTQGDPRDLFDGKALRLVENRAGSTGQYIALSYCWGKSLAYTTTTTNLQTHKQAGGIRYAHLPKTLQDAIFLVRSIGFQYLWIDSICIVQDSRTDWEQEASRMADVYRNAYLTIAATRASHCGEGFLQARKVRERQVVSFADKEGVFELNFSYDDLTISPGSMDAVVDDDIMMRKEGPLLDRVWCFQERVLASRTLHFATDQMYWECAQQVETEDGIFNDSTEYVLEKIAGSLNTAMEVERPREDLSFQNPDEAEEANAARRLWFRLIERYTSRNITYQSDKLPALSGVVSALQELTGDTCYAGIWKSWFLKGLLWRLQVPDWDLYVFTPKEPHKPDAWRAPSWSFTSVEGVVLYSLLEIDPGGNLCAELEECSVISKGKNPLGELQSGFARIRGPITSIVNVTQELTSTGRECMIQMVDQTLAEGGVYFDTEPYEYCDVLMITPRTGIAIVPVETDKDTYVRVGAVSVYRIWYATDESDRISNPAYVNRDRFLSASNYPESRSITLL